MKFKDLKLDGKIMVNIWDSGSEKITEQIFISPKNITTISLFEESNDYAILVITEENNNKPLSYCIFVEDLNIFEIDYNQALKTSK